VNGEPLEGRVEAEAGATDVVVPLSPK